jgi:hypothetical protein
MNLANGAQIADFAGLVLGFILTVMVLSYLLGDNPFFRLAVHIFIGVSAGFALVVVLYNILWNQVALPIVEQREGALFLLVPLFFGLWLVVAKSSRRLSRLGSPVMAYLVGAGIAAAVAGALLGTIFPQIGASTDMFDLGVPGQTGQNVIQFLFNGLLVLVGTITTLLYFHFGVRSQATRLAERHPLIEQAARVGQGFIAVALGAIFAGAYSAALSALIERLDFIVDRIFIENLLPLFTAL